MTLRVGFLGYRFMGKAHANALARLPMFFPDAPEVTRAVLVGRDEEALAAAADRLGFEKTTTDWEAALDEIDVFYNLAPNYLHPEPTIAALERDVNVLCEKPLAHDLDAAERMVEAATESDAIAGIAFNYRFLPAIRMAKAVVESGEIGDVRQFRGRYLQDWLVDPDAPWSWRLDEDLAGSGALGDLGAHTIDLARYLVGDVERVSGQLRTFVEERPEPDGDEAREVTVDDAYTAQLAFENGAMGTVEGSRVAPGHKNDQTIRVHGTAGSLQFSLERPNELAVKEPEQRGYETRLVTDETDPYVDHWWPPGHVLGWEHAIINENFEFLRAIDRGEPYQPNFEAGVAVQRVLDATVRSDEATKWMPL
ncbi:Gfo/Idh/MocA family protein [Halorientalis brevis]|uniref:Gfo/Idh/MocA family protein n=1 Tax=Halorientalis brevis TaxID=1126241 RepID=A0ABD6CEU0_9EURY|nr:Gfo/Idh/MocA family oxidoreductase [Halorientalis brevis]